MRHEVKIRTRSLFGTSLASVAPSGSHGTAAHHQRLRLRHGVAAISLGVAHVAELLAHVNALACNEKPIKNHPLCRKLIASGPQAFFPQTMNQWTSAFSFHFIKSSFFLRFSLEHLIYLYLYLVLAIKYSRHAILRLKPERFFMILDSNNKTIVNITIVNNN